MKTDTLVQELTDSFGDWFLPGCKNPAGGAAKMTQNLYPYDSIFSPIRVNRLTIKNRLVMAPMGNISMCDETGRPNAKMLKYFEERARGGVGLITTGLIPVSYGIDKSLIELGDLSRRSLATLTDGLVPALQRKGLMRRRYEFEHLRDNLLSF